MDIAARVFMWPLLMKVCFKINLHFREFGSSSSCHLSNFQLRQLSLEFIKLLQKLFLFLPAKLVSFYLHLKYKTSTR